METINGISFEDWAAACGNLSQGMPEQKIIEILGIEKPVWDDTMDKWSKKLGELMAADMNLAKRYGDIFGNPKIGKFADGKSVAADINDLLKIVPDYDAYQKIFWHQSKASEHGVDPITVIEEYGLDIGKWSQLGMHYSAFVNEFTDFTDPRYNERFNYVNSIMNKWQQHFDQYYKDNKVDLGGDINF